MPHQMKISETMTTPSGKDGLWGWIVVLACFMVRVFLYGMTTTSGILYVVFLDEFNESKGATAIIGSLITAAGFFIGTLGGVLVNRFGCRTVVILAGLIAGTGLIASSFAQSVLHLIITYGVIAGCGFGLCYVPCSVLVSQYFDKKRNLALGIAASGGGLGSFIFPIILRWLISIYGWRGTLAIAGGLTFNICVCGALMRPFVENNNNAVDMTKSQIEISKALFHWDIFKNRRYCVFMINHFLFAFAISVIYVHLAAFGKTIGINEDQSAKVFSSMGAVLAVSKILTGVLATHPRVDEHAVYIVMLFMGGLAVVLLPVVENLYWFGCMASIFGASYATLGGCIVPALCVRYGGMARLSTAYGVSLVLDGFGNFAGAPLAGVLYDCTGVYANSFYLAGSLTLVSALIMFVPWRMSGRLEKIDIEAIESGSPEKAPLKDQMKGELMPGVMLGPGMSMLSLESLTLA